MVALPEERITATTASPGLEGPAGYSRRARGPGSARVRAWWL